MNRKILMSAGGLALAVAVFASGFVLVETHVSQAAVRPDLTSDLPAYLPARVSQTPLRLGAASAYALDVDSGQVLYSQNASEKRPIASITKIVTAMVILKDHKLTDTVTVPQLPKYAPADELMGLVPGEKFTVKQMLYAALVGSNNDAADALAIWDSGSIPAFASKMNQFTSMWGVKDTHFVSAEGLVDDNNYATAQALAKLGKLILAAHDLPTIISTPGLKIVDQAGRAFDITSTDSLLSTGKFLGIKTGYTPAAGESFLGLADINGHKVITVILGANDRFSDTQKLVDWIKTDWQWRASR